MTPEALRRYRTRHVISVVVSGPRAPLGVPVCAVDGLRVIQRRSGARPHLWRHDPDEIKRLAAIEASTS